MTVKLLDNVGENHSALHGSHGTEVVTHFAFDVFLGRVGLATLERAKHTQLKITQTSLVFRNSRLCNHILFYLFIFNLN